jgi:hypothetical protein
MAEAVSADETWQSPRTESHGKSDHLDGKTPCRRRIAIASTPGAMASANSRARRATRPTAASSQGRHTQPSAQSADQDRPARSRLWELLAARQDRLRTASTHCSPAQPGNPPARQRAKYWRVQRALRQHALANLTTGSRVHARQERRNEHQARQQRAAQADQQQLAHARGAGMLRHCE